jgi:mannose-6-phosphate isomerase-like protein (cupin superfamily)
VLAAGDTRRVERYGFQPGAALTAHRHAETERLLIVLAGTAHVEVGRQEVLLREGESVLGPAGVYHAIRNSGTERLVVQQVSADGPRNAADGRTKPR